jgi:hypothetical protein
MNLHYRYSFLPPFYTCEDVAIQEEDGRGGSVQEEDVVVQPWGSAWCNRGGGSWLFVKWSQYSLLST